MPFVARPELLFPLGMSKPRTRQTVLAIMCSSSVRMTRTAARPAAADITPATMIDSMPPLLMISIGVPNQAYSMLGAKRAQRRVHWWRCAAPVALDELVDLAVQHLLDVPAGEGLADARGVHVELDRRPLAGRHVALVLNLTSSKGDHVSEYRQ